MDINSLLNVTPAQTGSSTTANINIPSGSVTGDLGLVWTATIEMTGTITPSSGFSALLNIPESGQMTGAIYGKVITSSEPSTWDFTMGSAITGWGIWAARIPGMLVDLSNFPTFTVIGTPSTGTNTGTSVTVPGQSLGIPPGTLLLSQVISRGIGGSNITSNGGKMHPILSTITFSTRNARGFIEAPTFGDISERIFDIGNSTTHSAGVLALRPKGFNPAFRNINQFINLQSIVFG